MSPQGQASRINYLRKNKEVIGDRLRLYNERHKEILKRSQKKRKVYIKKAIKENLKATLDDPESLFAEGEQ